MGQKDPRPGKEAVTPVARENLIQTFDEREQVGLEQYGITLQTWNGRSWHQDGIEELADLVKYLMQGQMEHRDLQRWNQELTRQNQDLRAVNDEQTLRLRALEAENDALRRTLAKIKGASDASFS